MSVLIVGGGMTGATLALAISRLTGGKLPVHLIEATAPESARHPGFDARAIALAAGTCQQLARVDIWQEIADRATAIQRVHVSDRGHAGFVTLEAKDYGLAALGQVVELHDVGQRLFAQLRKAPGVTLHCPAKVENVSRREESVSLVLDNGETLSGKLLVAADARAQRSGPAAVSAGSKSPMNSWRLLPTSVPLCRTTGAPSSVLPNTVRWRCCPCRRAAAPWCGVIRSRGKKRF